ncbi:Uncharacterised protein [Kluyvera cryocrescens]|uniref:UPF0387 membrane protein YohO n=1 Tax=Kluyvera cryocrescens TaxID=580 RepID=A0A485BVJ1_KLUCR|nr:Uncharacterised protein [Kluyvera cryocrescens]
MKSAKLAAIVLFAFMAISGIGGVMLAGYSFIVRRRCRLSRRLSRSKARSTIIAPAPLTLPPAPHKPY